MLLRYGKVGRVFFVVAVATFRRAYDLTSIRCSKFMYRLDKVEIPFVKTCDFWKVHIDWSHVNC